MMKSLLATVAAVVILGMSAAVPAQARVSERFYGRVIHVSTDNIKVRNPHSGKILSFVFVPGVTHTIDDAGRPQAATHIHVGERVNVVYDTTALGIRHLDRVIDLGRA